MVLVTMRQDLRPRPSRQVRQTPGGAVKIMFQVTEIVRFLLASERGLRFRNLGFCGHNLM
jgi:hypothetical protein